MEFRDPMTQKKKILIYGLVMTAVVVIGSVLGAGIAVLTTPKALRELPEPRLIGPWMSSIMNPSGMEWLLRDFMGFSFITLNENGTWTSENQSAGTYEVHGNMIVFTVHQGDQVLHETYYYMISENEYGTRLTFSYQSPDGPSVSFSPSRIERIWPVLPDQPTNHSLGFDVLYSVRYCWWVHTMKNCTIFSNGTLMIEEWHGDEHSFQYRHLTPLEISDLREAFLAVNLSNLSNSYRDNGIADENEGTITFSIDGHIKTIEVYPASGGDNTPQGLYRFIRTILCLMSDTPPCHHLGFSMNYSVYNGFSGLLRSRVLILENGSVFTALWRGNASWSVPGQLDEDDFHTLQDLVENADVFNLSDWYQNDSRWDLSLHTLTFQVNNQVKTIQWYDDVNGSLPESLTQIVMFLNQFNLR